MAVKELFRRLRPVRLYLTLFLTIVFFAVELVANYVTHSLTLLLNAYHMLCNIIALLGYIATIKCEKASMADSLSCLESSTSDSSCSNANNEKSDKSEESAKSEKSDKTISNESMRKRLKQRRCERRIKNTFGWARIDVVMMLICCVLLASFCFSLILGALQALIHVDHRDAMHQPVLIFQIGAAGVVLNFVCYLLIGGYTFNQGVFLHFTKEGDIVMPRETSSEQSIKDSEESPVQDKRRRPMMLTRSQQFREFCRDVMGCVFVMITAFLVHYLKGPDGEESYLVRAIDPLIAIIAALFLFALSFPYMKESMMILLQTIPNHINIESLQKDLLKAFPDIVNVHDLHVWQLNGTKVVSTVHIIYSDPTVCARITDRVTSFFVEMGITHVTIQPEFCKMIPHSGPHIDCQIRCQGELCSASQCCGKYDDPEDGKPICKKLELRQLLPMTSGSTVDLKNFKINIGDETIDDTEPGRSATDRHQDRGDRVLVQNRNDEGERTLDRESDAERDGQDGKTISAVIVCNSAPNNDNVDNFNQSNDNSDKVRIDEPDGKLTNDNKSAIYNVD